MLRGYLLNCCVLIEDIVVDENGIDEIEINCMKTWDNVKSYTS